MRIQTLTLLTTQLEQMKHFYHKQLHFDLVCDHDTSFSVKIGSSILSFTQSNKDTNPFYHFALNIPWNQIQEAKSWIKSITPLNIHNGEEEVFFQNWDAHAIYFTDPAGNIVEFIARHHDPIPESSQPFNSKQVISISEIGIVTTNVQAISRQIKQMGIKEVRTGDKDFAPLGDVEGLFIIVKDQRTWFFSDQPAYFYPVKAEIEGIGVFHFHKIDEVDLFL